MSVNEVMTYTCPYDLRLDESVEQFEVARRADMKHITVTQ
jgi:hypothetical protein